MKNQLIKALLILKKEAAEILKNANIANLIVGDDLGDGAAKAVAAAKGE